MRRQVSIDFLPDCSFPLELIGSKIKALIERSATRDLYDVDNICYSGLVPDKDINLLRKIVLFYLSIGQGVPRDMAMFANIDAISFKDIRTSLLPVLKKGTFYDYESVKIRVKKFLVSLMTPSVEEINYIEAFESGYYKPELLFEDSEIISRIHDHPMALWKTRKIF